MSAATDQSASDPPTTVTFEVEKGQVWIDREGIAWYVASVGAFNTILERTVVETVLTRDLVRAYRQMNETHPLHPDALGERCADAR